MNICNCCGVEFHANEDYPDEEYCDACIEAELMGQLNQEEIDRIEELREEYEGMSFALAKEVIEDDEII